MSYDSRYQTVPDYFGAGPARLLAEYLHLIDPDGFVVDVGCGQGRNALYLARSGRRVAAMDPSRVAVAIVDRLAGGHDLPIETHACGFEEFRTAPGSVAGVLLFGIENADTPEGEIRTYLEPGEILGLFGDWEILHHREGLGPEHRHGDRPPERHSRIEALVRKQAG